MTDKKYVLSLVGCVLSLAIIIYILTLCLPQMYYMDEEYPYWQQQKDYVLRKGENQEIIFLGDSRTKYGVATGELGENVYNLALGGGSPIEMYYTLNNYLQHHPKPRAVMIAFAPLHYESMGSYVGRNLYFHYLPNDVVDEVNKVIKDKDGTDLRWESIPYKYRLPNIYMNAVMQRLLRPNTEVNTRLYKRVEADKGWTRIDRALDLQPETNGRMETFAPLPSLTYYMDKILALCEEYCIPCYIEQLPVPGAEQNTGNITAAAYKEYFKELQGRYHVHVNDNIPVYDGKYFLDGSHLNEKGAKRYTKELKEKYKELFAH